MSKTIEERVVSMQFNNTQFEKGVEQSQKSIQNLNKSLDTAGTTNGLGSINIALESVSSGFSAFGAIGFTILQNLTNKAIDAGSKIANALLSPIIEGGKTRALNIEQAMFQFEALGLDVEAVMADASYAVDGTAYSLDAAAKVAAQLGASGMQAGEDMKTSLRGVSGVAAFAGSSYEDIGNIFTKIAGQGRLMGDDLLRLSSRGINAAAIIGQQIGKTEKQVREMVTAGKIDFKTFATAMDGAFGAHASKANETFTGSLANIRAALARIGANVATPLFKSAIPVFNAFREVVNDLNKALTPATDALAEFFAFASKKITAGLENVNLENFTNGLEKGIEGLKAMIPTILSIFNNIGKIFGSFRKSIGVITGAIFDAFSRMFPVDLNIGTIVSLIEKFSGKFADLVQRFEIGEEAGRKLSTIFEAVFAIFELGVKVVGVLAKGFVSLLEFLRPVSWLLLNVAEAIALFVLDVTKAIKENELFEKMLRGASIAAGWLQTGLENLLGVMGKFVDWFKNTNFAQGFVNVLGHVVDFVRNAYTVMQPLLQVLGKAIGWVFGKIGEFVGFVIETLGSAEAGNLIGSGVLGVLAISFLQIKDTVFDVVGKVGPVIDSFKSIFDGVRGSIEQYQKTIKANTLLKIALAMGVLAAAILVISNIDPDRLAASLAALALLFGELFGAMAIFNASTKGDFKGITKVGAAMVLLSVAVAILSKSIEKLGSLDMATISKGLLAITVVLGEFIAVAKLLTGIKGFAGAAASLIILSTALLIMASAVQKFGNMKPEVIGKGLLTVTAALGIMVAVAHAMPTKKMISASTGLVIMSAGLLVMAKAVERFGKMKPEVIIQGLLSIAGALAILTIAMLAIPADTAVKAIGLTILAASFLILGKALENMGSMSWEEIAKGLVTLAASLTIIGVAMYFMAGAVVGAAAMLIMAAALAVFVPVLILMSKLTWGEIAKGLITLAGVFAVIGVAGLLLAPLTPILLGLAAAIVLLGVGVLAIGAGLLAFSIGLTTLAAAGSAGAQALENIVLVLIGLIPKMLVKFGEGILELVDVLRRGIPTIAAFFGELIDAMIIIIGEKIPAIVGAFLQMLDTLLEEMSYYIPRFVDFGLKTVVGILEGIANNMEGLVTMGLLVIENFLLGLANGLPGIIDAGFKLIISFIDGISNAISENSEEMGRAGARLAMEIVKGMVKGILGGIKEVTDAAKRLANNALQAAKNALGIKSPSREFLKIGIQIIQGLVNGVEQKGYLPVAAIKEVAERMLTAITDAFGIELPTTLLDSLVSINDKMIASMNEVVEEARTTAEELASALAEAQKAMDDFNNRNAASTSKTVKEAQDALNEFNETQRINAQRQALQNAVNNAGSDAAKAAAQRRLDSFDAEQERKRIAAERKALEAELALAKQQEAAEEKRLKEELAAAKAAEKAAQEELAAREKAAKELAEFTENTIVPLETELSNLKEEYDELTASIEEATSAFEDASKEMNDYKANVKSAFTEAAKLTSTNATRNTQQYLDSLQDTLDEALEYEENIMKLVDLGLSQEAIDDIMSQGVKAASATVKYLLDGADEDTIAAINASMKAIEEVGERLGETLGNEYYQAGVDAAEGLLNGLKSKEEELMDLISDIGEKLAEAMKKALEIKSPSRVMFAIGNFTMQGLINGMVSLSDKVGAAGVGIAEKLKDGINKALELVDNDMDFNPVITPIIDLDNVRKGFDTLNDMIDQQQTKANTLDYSFGNTEEPVNDTGDVINNSTEVIQNFNDRTATPVEIYNATKFGLRRAW